MDSGKLCICSCQCAFACRTRTTANGNTWYRILSRVCSGLPRSPHPKARVGRLLFPGAPAHSAEERGKPWRVPLLTAIWGAVVAGASVPCGQLCSPPATPVPIMPPMDKPCWGDCSKAACRTLLNSYSVTCLRKDNSAGLCWGSQEDLSCPPAAQAVLLPVKNSRREGAEYKLKADSGFLRVACTVPGPFFEYITEH